MKLHFAFNHVLRLTCIQLDNSTHTCFVVSFDVGENTAQIDFFFRWKLKYVIEGVVIKNGQKKNVEGKNSHSKCSLWEYSYQMRHSPLSYHLYSDLQLYYDWEMAMAGHDYFVNRNERCAHVFNTYKLCYCQVSTQTVQLVRLLLFVNTAHRHKQIVQLCLRN